MDLTPLRKFGLVFLGALLATFRVTAESETTPPTVEAVFPEPGAVHSLPTVEIHFTEPVSGVDASDLEANGIPCLDVRRVNPDIYSFTLPLLVQGEIELKWRKDSRIADLAEVPNPFTERNDLKFILLPPLRPGGVIISELVADNQKTIRDRDGDYSDWIELHNFTDADVDLDGWHLTDEPDQLTKWTFPDVTIPARAYLIVYASGKDRSSPTNQLHTNFKLKNEGEYLGLIAPDGAIVDDFTPGYPNLPENVAFGRANGAPGQTGFFTTATPGALNSTSGAGFAPEVVFSLPSQITTVSNLSLLLTLAAPTPDTEIRFTLDGSLPVLTNGQTYATPIKLNLSNAVAVRARAYRANYFPGPVRSETYTHMLSSRYVTPKGTNLDGTPLASVFTPDINLFRSDLPLLVINTYGKNVGEVANTPARFTLFEPKGEVASITNQPDFQSRGGIKVRGSSSTGLAKKQFVIQWTDEFNQDKELSVLGLPAESEWVLYAPNDYEPVCIHNPFIFQLARDIGEYAPRTRFVEVFLNRVGPLGTNQYQGLYVLMEKIGVGNSRISPPKLQPENTTLPEVSGPYVMKIDRQDPGDIGVSAGGQLLSMISPKEKQIRSAAWTPQRAYLVGFINAMNKGLEPANRRHPTNSYVNYIDMNAAIDYHIIEFLSGNVDTMVLSAYFHIPRGGKLVFGPHWDFDRALGSTDGRDALPRSWSSGPVFGNWFEKIFRDVEAWQQWVDRFQQLRTNYLSNPYTASLMDRLANEIRQAERRDFLRWKIPRRFGGYQGELTAMKNWVSNRLDFVDRQLAQPPIAAQPSGLVAPDTLINLSFGPNPSTNAAIWYTLDGSDPRAFGTSNATPTAILYTSPIAIKASTRLVARTRDISRRQVAGPAASTPWSAPLLRTFVTNVPPLLLTELHYHPLGAPDGEPFKSDDFEFLEFKNTSGRTLDLAGFKLTGDIEFTFPTNRGVLRLEPNARVVVVENTNAFTARYGGTAKVAGEYAGRLSDHRGRLRLVDGEGSILFDLTFFDYWIRPADGEGYSMVVRAESLAAYDLEQDTSWIASGQVHGSPGRADFASDVGPDTDRDQDGVPDAWESALFRDLTYDGESDADRDGYSNREEFIAGTDPLSVTNKPGITATPSSFGGNPVLRFPRVGARRYRLQSRDTLDLPWRDLLVFPAAAGADFGTFRDLTTTNGNRFYRVVTP